MSTSTTGPILPATSTRVQGESDIAPTGIVVHSYSTEGAALTLHLAGEIDHYSGAPVRSMLLAAAAYGYTELVLDTSRVSFCDSALLRIVSDWRRGGRSVRLGPDSQAVRHLMRMAHRLERVAPTVPARSISHRPFTSAAQRSP
ncbi:STAS domain-containing protein [Streptomyces sp. NPDC006879]|uniref:STAS domain-containing protein n=1 Tax=Streptomyces sp. NPDC006879 TaxID=3364767 RepID=UPI0036CBDE05